MSSYAAVADFTAVLGPTLVAELSAETGATADATVLQAVLDEASSLIDSYIGTPATSAAVVARLKPHCLHIAEFYLLGRRFAGRFDPSVQVRYEGTVAFLEKVAAGRIVLEGASRPSQQPTQGAASGSEPPVFVSDSEAASGLPYGTTP